MSQNFHRGLLQSCMISDIYVYQEVPTVNFASEQFMFHTG